MTHITLSVQRLKNKVENTSGVNKDIKEFSPEAEKITQEETNNETQANDDQNKKKKRKKNKKKNKVPKATETLEIGEIVNKYQLLSPNEFFSIILDIAKNKFSFHPKQAINAFHELIFMTTRMSKLSFLRDLCLSIG